jgi:catechol 2,3-dioxygenase-like lactoylglutathione lyase family enzyme
VVTIGKLFHVVHVTDDLETVDRWYDDVFSVERFYHDYNEVAKRDASLVLIGDFVMEPLALAQVPGAEATPMGRFHARYGQRLHSIAWYVDDVTALFEALNRHGLRMYGLAGNLLTASPREQGGTAIWTHPRETAGSLEFSESPYYRGLDPRFQPGWTPSYWRDEHPLGIERASHLTVLMRDPGRAKSVFGDALGGRPLHEETSTDRGTQSTFYAVGEETIVEVARPTTTGSLAGRDLEQNGELLHAVTFKVKDLRAAADYFRGKNIPMLALDQQTFILDPVAAFGAVLGFTDRSIPGDPRAR